MAYKAGDVVLVPFPYRDVPGERSRPGVVISNAAYNHAGDLVVAAVTSHAPRGPIDYLLQDWSAAGLKYPSTVRMLFATLAENRVLVHIGQLSGRDWFEVNKRVLQVFS